MNEIEIKPNEQEISRAWLEVFKRATESAIKGEFKPEGFIKIIRAHEEDVEPVHSAEKIISEIKKIPGKEWPEFFKLLAAINQEILEQDLIRSGTLRPLEDITINTKDGDKE